MELSSPISEQTRSTRIKAMAQALGFDLCGIAKACHVGESATHLKQWLDEENHGEMAWMENHFEKRCDPTLLVENAKSVIVVCLNYFPEIKQDESLPQIAYYAYGKDYHEVIRGKLNQLLHQINEEIAPTTGRGFADSAPVLERHWAQEAGLGWIGKNKMLIIPNRGSFFFLGTLIVDLELEYDTPMKSRCGGCSRCVSACPTAALTPHRLDARKCLAYLTIEKKGPFSESDEKEFHNRLFGCDLCQMACPWNRFSTPHTTAEFRPIDDLLSFDYDKWDQMAQEEFSTTFRHSAIKRTKLEGIKRNLIQLRER